MVPDTVLGAIGIAQFETGGAEKIDRFQNRQTVSPPSSQIVDLSTPGLPVKLQEQPRDVPAVDLVPNLFSLVPEDGVGPRGNRAKNHVSQIAVQLDGGVLRPRQAASTKYGHWHLEVSAEFLAHDVGGQFGSPEHRMQAVIDRHRFIDAITPVCIIVALLQFLQWQRIRPVA